MRPPAVDSGLRDLGVLAAIEAYIEDVRRAQSDQEIVEVMRQVAGRFGFRSAWLIEYKDDLEPSGHVLDTDEKRAEAWASYFRSDLHDSGLMRATLSQPAWSCSAVGASPKIKAVCANSAKNTTCSSAYSYRCNTTER